MKQNYGRIFKDPFSWNGNYKIHSHIILTIGRCILHPPITQKREDKKKTDKQMLDKNLNDDCTLEPVDKSMANDFESQAEVIEWGLPYVCHLSRKNISLKFAEIENTREIHFIENK